MKPILTDIEAAMFDRVGFSVKSEVIIKQKSKLNIMELAKSDTIDDSFFSEPKETKFTIYSIVDKNDTAIMLDLETKDEVIAAIKELVSNLM